MEDYKKLTILIDMDDTIEQLLLAWVCYLNERYGTSVSYADIKTWNVADAFQGLTKEQVYEVLDEEDLWKRVLPMPGAQESLKRLYEKGHAIYIVTATTYLSVKAKMEHVLFRYFPFISWKNVIITSNKQMLKADVLIDDGVHNLLNADYEKILMTAPNNLDFDAEKHGMFRVSCWTEAEEIIDMLAK